jgi:hypothetical protein
MRRLHVAAAIETQDRAILEIGDGLHHPLLRMAALCLPPRLLRSLLFGREFTFDE